MKNRMKLIVTILLAILLTGSTFSQQRQGDKIRMGDHFSDKLNLTEEQQTRIDDLRLQHQKLMIDLKADLQKKKIELKELVQKGNYTRADFLDKTIVVLDSENKIEIARANHKMDIYEQLDDSQKAIWNKKGFGMHSKWEKHKRMKHKRIDVD